MVRLSPLDCSATRFCFWPKSWKSSGAPPIFLPRPPPTRATQQPSRPAQLLAQRQHTCAFVPTAAQPALPTAQPAQCSLHVPPPLLSLTRGARVSSPPLAVFEQDSAAAESDPHTTFLAWPTRQGIAPAPI
jgi:hypothetical protein